MAATLARAASTAENVHFDPLPEPIDGEERVVKQVGVAIRVDVEEFITQGRHSGGVVVPPVECRHVEGVAGSASSSRSSATGGWCRWAAGTAATTDRATSRTASMR